jgi:chitosanase
MNDLSSLIKKVLLAFEQSRTSIRYEAVYLWDDGPKNIKQITLSFGITEHGNLKKFIDQYIQQNGRYAKDFAKYTSLIGKQSLVSDNNFINLLKESAQDPTMQQCQEKAFDSMYITPALNWCSKNNLILPLSKLVIADSFLHSGSILTQIRNAFKAKIPSNGGDEKEWITQYCQARRQWLSTHSRKDLHKTVYRPNFLLSLIVKNDWHLNESIYVANGVKIVAK